MTDLRSIARQRFFRRILRAESATFAALLTAGTQGVIVVLNLLTGVITARLLGVEGRGIFAAVTIWPQFLCGVAQMGLATASVYLIKKAPEEADRIISAGVILTLLASGGAVALGLVAVALTMRQFDSQTILLADFCVLWTPVYMLTVSLRQVEAAKGNFGAFNVSSLSSPLLYLVFLSVIKPWVTFDATIAALCLMASSLPTLLQLVYASAKTTRPDFGRLAHWNGALLQYAARAAPMEIAANLSQYVDKLALVYLISAQEIGLYMVAYSLSRVMLVLQTVIVSVLYPSMSGRSNVEVKLLHDRAFRILIALVALSVVLAHMFGGLLLALVYGRAFAAASLLLDLLLLEAGVSCVAQVVVQLYLSVGRPSFSSVAQLVGLAATVAAVIALISQFGALGAAIGLLVGSAVRLLVLLAGLPAVLGMPLPSPVLLRDDVSFILAKIS